MPTDNPTPGEVIVEAVRLAEANYTHSMAVIAARGVELTPCQREAFLGRAMVLRAALKLAQATFGSEVSE